MEPKKISFGFTKINKKLNVLTNKEALKNETKVELIKCLEGQEIKLVEEKPEEQPLIIPLKETQKTSAALASLIKRRAVLLGEDEQEQISVKQNKQSTEVFSTQSSNESEDIEKQAARELLAELHANGSSDPSSNLVLPVVKPDDLPLEGAKESSLDDYESIPIQDFGKAMLRGMGWTEPPKVTPKGGPPIDDTPMVRPKGMGLGADKALKKQPLLVAPESNEVLEVKRNAYVRILGGKHKDMYGQIEGFDDHAGRVIVKMAIGGFKEAFNEFLCQAVSRKEYAQYGKCINSTKYEEYKKKENEFGQIILEKDELDKLEKNTKDNRNIKKERRDSLDGQVNDYKYHKNSEEKEQKSEIYKDVDGREKNREDEKYRHKERDNERANKREKNGDDEKDRKRDVKTEKHREDDKVRNRDRDEKREKKREDDKDRTRENYRDNDRDDEREKYRVKEKERRNELDRSNKREHKRNKDRDEEQDRNRERERYESKYDRNQRTQSYKDNTDTRKDLSRDRERDSQRYNRDRDYYQDNRDERKNYDRDDDRNTKRNDKVIQIEETTDSDSHKHKKLSTRDIKSKKKSKKSKKSKSRHRNDTSDSETSTSSDSSSDSEKEKRKKHKKKTKKSKKQRERSRSRGRR